MIPTEASEGLVCILNIGLMYETLCFFIWCGDGETQGADRLEELQLICMHKRP